MKAMRVLESENLSESESGKKIPDPNPKKIFRIHNTAFS
jgi:hypothetical protein